MNRSKVPWIAFGLVGLVVFVFFLRTEPAQLAFWEDDVIAASEAYRKREFAEAERLLETAVKKAERLPAEGSRLAATLADLAEVNRVRGKYTEAERHISRALELSKIALGEHDPRVVMMRDTLTRLRQARVHEEGLQKLRYDPLISGLYSLLRDIPFLIGQAVLQEIFEVSLSKLFAGLGSLALAMLKGVASVMGFGLKLAFGSLLKLLFAAGVAFGIFGASTR